MEQQTKHRRRTLTASRRNDEIDLFSQLQWLIGQFLTVSELSRTSTTFRASLLSVTEARKTLAVSREWLHLNKEFRTGFI